MAKRLIGCILLLCIGFLFSGCHTIEGAGKGVGAFAHETYQGMKKDWHDASQWDKKFREKYW